MYIDKQCLIYSLHSTGLFVGLPCASLIRISKIEALLSKPDIYNIKDASTCYLYDVQGGPQFKLTIFYLQILFFLREKWMQTIQLLSRPKKLREMF